MTLKSYRSSLKKKKKVKKKRSSSRDLITGGVTALIGTAFVAQTANVLNRI